MIDVVMLLKSIFAGFVIAVPIGAVGALCLRRGFQGRWLLAMIGGLGAAAADSLLAAAALLGMSLATSLLIDDPGPARLIGGLFLVGLGVQMIRKRDLSLTAAPPPMGDELRRWWKMTRALSTGFLLTIVNPATFLAFVGAFAGLGLFNAQPIGDGVSVMIVLGVFAGSMLWWITLTVVACAVRHYAPLGIVAVVNGTLGLIVLGIGIAALVSFARMML